MIPSLKYTLSLKGFEPGPDVTDELFKEAERITESLKDGSRLVCFPVVEDVNHIMVHIECYS